MPKKYLCYQISGLCLDIKDHTKSVRLERLFMTFFRLKMGFFYNVSITSNSHDIPSYCTLYFTTSDMHHNKDNLQYLVQVSQVVCPFLQTGILAVLGEQRQTEQFTCFSRCFSNAFFSFSAFSTTPFICCLS